MVALNHCNKDVEDNRDADVAWSTSFFIRFISGRSEVVCELIWLEERERVTNGAPCCADK